MYVYDFNARTEVLMSDKKIAVGRAINGISINGLEYILDSDNEVMLFNSTEKAKEFLTEHGVDAEDESFFYEEQE